MALTVERKKETEDRVVRLHDVEGYSFTEIGRLLKLTTQRVYAIYKRWKDEQPKV